MKKSFSLFILVFFAFSSSILRSQTANFTEGCAPLDVTFTPKSGISSYYWDFNNNKSSNLPNPSTTYDKPGTYTVTLKEGVNGSVVGTIQINVYAKPELIIQADHRKGCAPLTVQMNYSLKNSLPQGVNIISSEWTFGDLKGDNNKTNVINTYNKGIYDVSIGINTNLPSCKITKLEPKFISASTPPSTSFSTTPSSPSVCKGPLTISFNNTSTSELPITYAWDFGNTQKSTDKNGKTQTYTSDGKYLITLTSTDTNTCSSSYSIFATVGNPTASLKIKDTVCLNVAPLYENNSSTGAYTWTFDNGTSIQTSYQAQPYFYFTKPGLHQIKLKVQTGNCFDDTIRTVFVEDPTVSIISSPKYTCHDTLTAFFSTNSISKIKNFNWTFQFDNQFTTSIDPKPKQFFNTYDSTYHYRKNNLIQTTLNITTESGCFASSKVDSILISEMWARFVPDIHQGCKDLTINFADSSSSHKKLPIAKWSWDFGDGTPVVVTNSKTNPSHTYTKEGVYNPKLIVSDNNGCSDTSALLEVRVGKLLNIDFTASKTSICPGDSIKFTNTTDSETSKLIDAWHYSSDKEHTSHCTDESTTTLGFNDTIGSHTITLTGEYNGCQSTKQMTIDVKGPIAHFDYLLDCKTPMQITLINKAEGAEGITWDLGDTVIKSMKDTVVYIFKTEGEKNIKMTASSSNGCKNSIDSTSVHIGTVQSDLKITDSKQQSPIQAGNKFIIDAQANYIFDGTKSHDVHLDCYRGYSFITEKGDRPNTYNTGIDTFQLSVSGDQKIGMIVRNKNNCVDTMPLPVRVINTTADFTVFDSKLNQPISISCLPFSVNIGDSSISDTTIVKWEWDFGDGTNATYASKTNPIPHTYKVGTVSGNQITVNLKVTNNLGFSREKSFIISLYTPKAVITTVPQYDLVDSIVKICNRQSVQFAATPVVGNNFTYTWKYEDGKTNTSNQSDSTFTIIGAGLDKTEIVKVIYKETSSGCVDSTTQLVYIQKYPKAVITSDKDDVTKYCNPFQVTYFDKTSTKPNGTISTWVLTPSISINGDSASYAFPKGKHTIKLVEKTTNGCKDSTSKSITVIGPAGNFITDKTTICKGESIKFTITDTSDVASYRWDFGDGNVDSLKHSPINHPYYFLPPSGFTTATLVVYDKNLCPLPINKDISIRYVKANILATDLLSNKAGDTIICKGGSFKFENKSTNADIFSWDLGNGTKASSKDISSATYTSSDTINVTLYASSSTLSCKDTSTIQVIVSAPPVIHIIPDTICVGNSIQLKTIEDLSKYKSYQWSSLDLKPTETKIYSIDVVDTNGCNGSGSAQMIVIQKPDGTPFVDTIIIGEQIALPIDNQFGSLIFKWDPEKGLSCLDCSNPLVRPLGDTVYNVVMTDVRGCFNTDKKFTIIVKPDIHIKLPTTFTPNGDGINEIVYVEQWGVKELISFEIYNRWGEKIFQTNKLEEGWDGTFKGELQNNDVYAYKVTATSWLNTEVSKEGYIHLMR